MKRVIGCVSLLLLAALAGWSTPVTVSIGPTSTFIYTAADDLTNGVGPANAVEIFLNGCTEGEVNCINAPPGSTLQIIGGGTLCYTGPNECTNSPEIAGAFDTQINDLLPSSSLPPGDVNRLPNSVQADFVGSNVPVPNVDMPQFFTTYFTRVDTTIPNDFLIPTGITVDSGTNGITVTVPNDAAVLYVGILDSFISDNTGNPSVELIDTIPEPATFVILGTGLGAIALLRRRRRD